MKQNTDIQELLSKHQNGTGQNMNACVARSVWQLPSYRRFGEFVRRFSMESEERATEANCWQSLLEELKIEADVDVDVIQSIPKSGPLVVVSNHPLGGLDGIVLGALIRRVRPDVKVLANHMLSTLPAVGEEIIAVNPYGGADAVRDNIRGVKETIQWLKAGHAIIVFPSGAVSDLKIREHRIVDTAWNENIARFVRASNANVVPAYIDARSSLFFHFANRIHSKLRTVLFPRELLRKRNSKVGVVLGKTVRWKQLEKLGSDNAIIHHLRLRSEVLRPKLSKEKKEQKEDDQTQSAIIPATEKFLLSHNIETLPDESRLITKNNFSVYIAKAWQLPYILPEIGRLREITFRAVGEGTGKCCDVDSKDDYYLHLFLWDHEKCEIAGAYRIGQADKIMENHGVEGLYTSKLFDYSPELLDQLNPALELGRSFICQEYQRQYAPLLLMWKGIGEFVNRNPRYKRLFGAVSMSNCYKDLSQELLLTHLKEKHSDPMLASFVTPRNPPDLHCLGKTERQAACEGISSFEELSDVVSSIEPDGKGAPVLIRQYLKLNGKILGFNVDSSFGDVMDSLIVVDLQNTDERYRELYLGG